MCTFFQLFNILAVLLVSAHALKRKALHKGEPGEIEDFDVFIGEDVVETVNPASSLPWKPGEPHRACNVDRGTCTKKLKPTLFLIGEPFSGSTSLANMMALHPELSFGDTKEHQFFYFPVEEVKDMESYVEQFWVSCNTTVSFDASVSYLSMGNDRAVEMKIGASDKELESASNEQLKRIKHFRSQVGPHVKLMAMFRDPVDLQFHKYCSKAGLNLKEERPNFMKDPPNASMASGPSKLLQNWLKVYPHKSSWLFLSTDEYVAAPKEVLRRVFKFAGVNHKGNVETDLPKDSTGRRRCNVKAKPRDRQAFWSVKENMEDKRALEHLTGLHFKWNSKK